MYETNISDNSSHNFDISDSNILDTTFETESEISSDESVISEENNLVELQKPNLIEDNEDKNICKTILAIPLVFINFIMDIISSDIAAFIEIGSKLMLCLQYLLNKKIFKIICLIIIIVIALVHCKTENVLQNYTTKPLFWQHSIVTDFYKGDLSLLRDLINESDLTLAMYYAPWDRQSQNFVQHFVKAAQYHHEQVTFAAINCWLPQSECKQHLNLHSYPLVVLYVRSHGESLAIPYNGPLLFHNLIRYITKAIRPMNYISSQDELHNAQQKYEAIVVGYYAGRNWELPFLSFYYAALHHLQFEHLSEVGYGILTNAAFAQTLELTRKPSIAIITPNSFIAMPHQFSKSALNITTWVAGHVTSVSRWLRVSGSKSLEANLAFGSNPALVVFTPDNPYHSMNDVSRLVRSVALEYNDCSATSISGAFRPEMQREMERAHAACSDHLKRRFQQRASRDQKENLNSRKQADPILSNYDKTPVCQFKQPYFWNHIPWSTVFSSFFKGEWFQLRTDGCLDPRNLLPSCTSAVRNVSYSNKNITRAAPYEDKVSFGGPLEDDRVPLMLNRLSEDYCKRLAFGSLLGAPPQMNEHSDLPSINVRGLGCRRNKTLSFVVVDSLLHEDFAQHLGFNLSNKTPKMSGAMIIDPILEEKYYLKKPLSRSSISHFMHNYTKGLSSRSKHLSNVKNNGCRAPEICLLDLNINSYLDLIAKPNQAAVVLHSTVACGACAAASTILLACSHFMKSEANVMFARIDVAKNTLPWNLDFHELPTIVYFPPDKSEEPRIFDGRVETNVPNVMAFVMSSLRADERHSIALKFCDRRCQKITKSSNLLERVKLHYSILKAKFKIDKYQSVLDYVRHQLSTERDNLLVRSKFDLYSEASLKEYRKLAQLQSRLRDSSRQIVFPSEVFTNGSSTIL